MLRWTAAFVLTALTGSPVLACASMIVRHTRAAEHACCKRTPQPEPKCCLLNPPAGSEAKTSQVGKTVPLVPAMGVSAGPPAGRFQESFAVWTAGTVRFDLYLQNRRLRL